MNTCPHCTAELKYFRSNSISSIRVYGCGRVLRRNIKSREVFAMPCDPQIAAENENWFYRAPEVEVVTEEPKVLPYWPMLQVPMDADLATITRAWKTRAKELHPDKNTADTTSDFQALEAEYAYATNTHLEANQQASR